MSKEIRANYKQKLMFPRSVENWVRADHPARFLRELVDSLELTLSHSRGSVSLRPRRFLPKTL